LLRRTLVTPRNPRSGAQQVIRQNLATQAAAYDQLTEAQQQAWIAAAAQIQSKPSLGQSGPLTGLGTDAFWVGANILYWLAWMNLLLGLSNALPLVPLDGGLLFRDFAASIAARWHRAWDAARLDAFGTRAVAYSSVIVLVLLVWQFVVPRLL
jgi:membrane-associated protease RseP (regulator of RpoE activity)